MYMYILFVVHARLRMVMKNLRKVYTIERVAEAQANHLMHVGLDAENTWGACV